MLENIPVCDLVIDFEVLGFYLFFFSNKLLSETSLNFNYGIMLQAQHFGIVTGLEQIFFVCEICINGIAF